MFNRWQLNRAAVILNAGGVIAYPTESVFGLGCDPDNLMALQTLLNIKQRAPGKGLIIVVSNIAQAMPYIQPLTAAQLAQISQPRDRATTWLIPRQPHLSPLLCGKHDKLAVRVSRHPLIKMICDYRSRALVSSSCNLQGKPEMKTSVEVRNKMTSQLDMVFAGRCGGQKPSQIIDLISGQIIRH